ncbi:MAG: RsmB/NOP family class I SAM-dependent RNA methyltransferase [Betaproteobacteria bacterium]|nr:RsmB/NOP family class I SAM-dependent RNA methyltransferase [Betaproteobacteria bacterium]
MSLRHQLYKVFEALGHFEAPADVVLRGHFRANPQLGRSQRHQIAEACFYMLRHRRRLNQQPFTTATKDWPQDLKWNNRASLIEKTLYEMRNGFGDLSHLPAPIKYSLPEWLYERLMAQGASDLLFQALLEPAALDLRIATWHPKHQSVARERLIDSLREEGIVAHPHPDVAQALRVEGKPALEKSASFNKGLLEVQDVASQAVAALLAPRRNQTLVDFCAGAGGKTLVVRSGLSNVQPFAIDSEVDPKLVRLASKADAVLVDAPCSGFGTLRRNPDLKWRFKADDLERLVVQQASILQAASRLVRPGGWLVYATCSLLREENQDQVLAFLEASEQFELESPMQVLQSQGISLGRELALESAGKHHGMVWQTDPSSDGCDGFFAARMRRRV